MYAAKTTISVVCAHFQQKVQTWISSLHPIMANGIINPKITIYKKRSDRKKIGSLYGHYVKMLPMATFLLLPIHFQFFMLNGAIL